MSEVQLGTEDRVWERVFRMLSEGEALSTFYKLPRHELRAVARAAAPHTPNDLVTLFRDVSNDRVEEARTYLSGLTPYRVYNMILVLGRAMKCWIETGNSPEKDAAPKKGRWTTAKA